MYFFTISVALQTDNKILLSFTVERLWWIGYILANWLFGFLLKKPLCRTISTVYKWNIYWTFPGSCHISVSMNNFCGISSFAPLFSFLFVLCLVIFRRLLLCDCTHRWGINLSMEYEVFHIRIQTVYSFFSFRQLFEDFFL